MTQARTNRASHAVVLGGSIVGTVTASILSEHFEHVTVLERDGLPESPGARGGVPHARHVHALLARGAAELERLFPGFLDEMVTAGARLIDIGRDVAWLTPSGWGVKFDSGFRLCCATRDLIEWQIRRRALARPNVTLRDGIAVDGLLTDPGRARVTGVRYRDRRRGGAAIDELAADLVVDATGRASQLPSWLAGIGRAPVRESVIDAGMSYASRFYALSPEELAPWRAAYVQPQLPHDPRGGILFPVEGNRWHLTLFGYADAAPPTDEEGFRAFAAGLRSSILSDSIRHATPLSPIVSHRRTENRWRHFHEMRDWPDGLVALGDAVCCFDPVYGQGITTGVLGALALRARLDGEWRETAVTAGFARRFQRDLVDVIRPAWSLATAEDLRLPTTVGGQLGAGDRLLQRYVDGVIAVSTADPAVRRRLLSVMNMVTRPDTLFHPRVFAGLLRRLLGLQPRPVTLWPEREGSASRGPITAPTPGAASLHASRIA